MMHNKLLLDNDILRELMSEKWSNAACCGYAILACDMLGYQQEEIANLINALNCMFDNYSIEQAKAKYMSN